MPRVGRQVDAAPSMFAREQAPFTVTAAFLMSLQPLLVTMSKNPSGGFSYSVPSSAMLSEALKLVISVTLLVQQLLSGKVKEILHEDSVSEFFSYVVPSFIYFINNNCLFFILQYVDPTTFQLLSQMKTIFTGLLFRVFLKRKLTAVQYLALITLACGTACSQLPVQHAGWGRRHATPPSMGTGRGLENVQPAAAAAAAATTAGRLLAEDASVHSYAAIGAMLSVLSSMLSALGGIYNEKLLKGQPSASIHWQNIQMYVWGVAFNALGAYLKDGDAMVQKGILYGYTPNAWAVVVCNALNGLAISAVLKYADNIARVYAHAIAMMLTMGVSTQLFDAPITPQLVLAVTLVATSTFQYNLPQSLLHDDALSDEMQEVSLCKESSHQELGAYIKSTNKRSLHSRDPSVGSVGSASDVDF